jgi:ribosomal protein S18 acetylase RimI-like enzyme
MHGEGAAFRIREATAADAADLAALAAGTFRDTFAADNDPGDLAAYLAQAYGPEIQARELADPAIGTLVIVHERRLVAFAQLRQGSTPEAITGSRPIELWRFYVDRTHHGRGMAQALMQAVLARATAAGAGTIWLGVWERNLRAQAFYRKAGFADVGTHVFVLGRDVQTDRLMARPVGTDAAEASSI